MKKKKRSLILGILLMVLTLGMGYAFLTTTLAINGTTDVDSNTWNVYWDNVQVTEGSVTASTPTISNQTTVTFSVHLSKPGDFYEFTVDVKNSGTIDAMIESINKTTTIPNYLNYTVTYADDVPIIENQLLGANSTESYKVRVEYRTDINPSDLPNNSQNITLSFGVEYVQGDDNAIPVVPVIYNVSNTSFTIGNNVPTGITTYDNYQEAITAFGHQFFLKHTVSNDVITKSYVGFVLNNNVYYLQGGIREENLETKLVYESNKVVLLNAFGSSKCTDNTSYYYCYDSTYDTYAYAYNYGNVFASSGIYGCSVGGVGNSYCGDTF